MREKASDRVDLKGFEEVFTCGGYEWGANE